jgi:hypothetical protein
MQIEKRELRTVVECKVSGKLTKERKVPSTLSKLPCHTQLLLHVPCFSTLPDLNAVKLKVECCAVSNDGTCP